MIVDANNSILGRLASKVSEKALNGEEITIINAEEAIITGDKEHILGKFKERFERGSKDWGPHYPRLPDRIVRRIIRGMLPHKKDKGEKALQRISVEMGKPTKIEKENIQKIATASEKVLASNRYVKVKEISQHLGWQQ